MPIQTLILFSYILTAVQTQLTLAVPLTVISAPSDGIKQEIVIARHVFFLSGVAVYVTRGII